jgi:hypothetical protein
VARLADIEIGFKRIQHLLAHPRVLSTKERTPKVRSSLPIIDRRKSRITLIMSPLPSQGYTLLTPTPHRDTCYAVANIVCQGCWTAIVVYCTELWDFEVTKFGPNDDAKIARAWSSYITPYRNTWYAATVSYTKGVGIVSTLTFEGTAFMTCTKILRLGVLVDLPSRTHPSSPPDDVHE